MRLMTTAGAYAGQVRDYDFGAAMAALKTGTAVRMDTHAREPEAATVTTDQPPAIVSRETEAGWRRGARRHHR